VKLIQNIKKNQTDVLKLLSLILLYTIPLFAIITLGIPNSSHPFTYNMDEWHQFQAVKAVFKHFSNNIPGAAHGTMFQFLLTGFYLFPFYLFHIINPFILKSSLDAPEMQEKIFILLRFNSIIFGIGSLTALYILAKKYLRLSPVITCLLFLATPVWIMLSNYFKYDIALTFWMICSLLALLRYRDTPSLRNLLISCAVCALALATKISALPVIPMYAIAFLLFTPKPKHHIRWIILGTLTFVIVFCLVGIPDVLLQRGDWREFLYSNLISGPTLAQNLKLNGSEFSYLFFQHYPVIFGHSFYLLIFLSLLYWVIFIKVFWKNKLRTNLSRYKTELFILTSFLLFLLSLLPLRLTAIGNRSLVLLPFFAIFCSMALKKIQDKFLNYKRVINAVVGLIIIMQIFESYAWLSIDLRAVPQQASSQWIITHIQKGSLIGLENIPIYQGLPDVILKDYYMKDSKLKSHTLYSYIVIDQSAKQLPPYIIITNADYAEKYLKTSAKKDLLTRISKDNYRKIAEFYPNLKLYYLFNNELNYYLSGLVATGPIEIYQRTVK